MLPMNFLRLECYILLLLSVGEETINTEDGNPRESSETPIVEP